MEDSKKGTVSWLLEFAVPHKSKFLTAVVCAILGVACSILPYFLMADMIVHLIQNDQGMQYYLLRGAAMAIIWIIRFVFHGISTSLSHRATFSVISEIRSRMTKKLTRLPMGYLLDTPSGKLKNIMVEKVDSIEPTLAHIVPEMTANIFISLSTIICLFVLDWRMALAALVPLPLGLLAYMGMMIGYEARFANYVAKNKHLNATAVEYINGIEVIKAFNQSASSYEKFQTAAREAAASAIDWMRSTQVYFSLALSVFPAVLVGVLPIGCLLYVKGTLSATTFIFAMILALGVMNPLIVTMTFTDDLGKISTVIGDLAEILGQADMERPETQVQLNGYDIELKDVSFAYGKEEILHKISLKLPADSVTAFVGPSGSGKSTIVKLIASLWDVTAGEIRLGGKDIRQIPLSQLNASVAYVAQDNYLFDDTIRNNIRMGKPQATDREVEEVARRSGCHEFIMALEKGYDTVSGGGGGHLSGGERQRIAIARAMLKDAPVIILDEATAYTDPENEAVIQKAVSRLVAGKTLLVVAHRLSTITDSDKIVVVNRGNIEAEGTHESLLQQCTLYKDMWEAHTAAKDEDGEVLS